MRSHGGLHVPSHGVAPHGGRRHVPQVSDAEWEQLRDADFSSAASLSPLPLTERWIVSSLHAVRARAALIVLLGSRLVNPQQAQRQAEEFIRRHPQPDPSPLISDYTSQMQASATPEA